MKRKNAQIKYSNDGLTLIAGPCSVDKHNFSDIYEIADIRLNGKRAVFGTRMVGLKSRTKFNISGAGMGIDHFVFMKNLDRVLRGKPIIELDMLPSIIMAQKIIRDTGLLVATEIMSPLIQLPLYERIIPKGKLLIWNPSVNQLGWPVLKMGHYAGKNGWFVGLKNGKWENMERNWLGLMHFAGMHKKDLADRLIFIQRGIDVARKGDHRNLPSHEASRRVRGITGAKVYFDPSHSLGPKLRHKIADAVVEAMRMKMDKSGKYLYDGVLIEVGRSDTDTEQHLTVREFKELCRRLSEFRTLISPD